MRNCPEETSSISIVRVLANFGNFCRSWARASGDTLIAATLRGAATEAGGTGFFATIGEAGRTATATGLVEAGGGGGRPLVSS